MSADGRLRVSEVCTPKRGCAYYHHGGSGTHKRLIVDGVPPMPLVWQGQLALLTVSLGSYDAVTYVVDGQHGVFAIEGLVALDGQRQCYARADYQGVYFGRLFAQGQPYVKTLSGRDPRYDFMQTATLLSVIEGEFDDRGDFVLSYLSESGAERQQRLSLPCGR